MTNAGEVNVKLGLDSDEFIKAWSNADDKIKELEKNLKKSKTDFENVSKAMAGTKTPSKELVNLFNELKTKLKEDQSALDGFQNKLDKLQGGLLNKANPAVNALTGSLMKLAGPAAIAVVAKKLVDLGVKATQTAAKFESLAVSFEVLTGSAEAGKKLTDEIVELASKTPLTTEALTDGAKTLLSFGESADEVIKDLKLLGDISGGNAQRMQSLTLAFAQIGSTGRLAGQDLLQMVNAGFNPLSIMAEKTGKSMKTLKDEMAAGKITFNDVKQAMIDATSEGGRFYGMMDKQSETLEGRLSTLSDTWTLVAKTIGEVFLPEAKKAVTWLNTLGEGVRVLTQRLAENRRGMQLLKQEASSITSMEEGYERIFAARKKIYEVERLLAEHRINREKGKKRIQELKEEIFYTEQWMTVRAKEANISKIGETKSTGGGFAALSSVGTTGKEKESEAAKKARKQKEDLLAISKSYAQEMANIESLETAKSDLAQNGGRFQRNYQEKLRILQWYYNEKYKITQTANGDIDKAQEQFNQLEELKNQKMLQANITSWTDWGNAVKNIMGNSLSSLLTTADNFGDTMMNIMNMIYQSLIKMAIEAAMKEIEITTIKTAIISALNAMTGGIGGAIAGIGGKITGLFGKKYHSGGLSTSEQVAVIRKDERVLNPAETAAYNSGQGGVSTNGTNNVMVFNIKAWDGKDVINTLKSNSQTINQIVASGIKNNNQGLRTTVQNT